MKIENLIRAFSSVRGRENAYNDAAKELGLNSYPVFTVNGGTAADWKQDIQLRKAIIEQKETLDKLKMRGVMLDLGTYYRTGLGSTRFAVTVSNFGAELAPDGDVVLIGNRTNSDWQLFAPPTIFRIGFAFEPFENEEHRVTTSIQLNHPNDNSENISLGAEYAWNKMLFARAGYKINVDEQNYSFGVGLNVPISMADFTFDYAFANFERLGSAHRFSIILGIK